MNSDPTFSVIIAAHNAAATLARALDSVLTQTYAAYEVIVVDDGSIDETAEVARAMGPAVTVIRQNNAGVGAARNTGARAAGGGWLAFLDADDWYYPQRLAWHRDLLERHPDVDFMTGEFDYRDEGDNLTGRSLEKTPLGRRLLESSSGDGIAIMEREDFPAFIHRHFGDTHTLSVPRARFVELGGYPAEFAVCEDVHLLIRLTAGARKVGVVCRPMAAYLVHRASATRRDPVRAQRQTVAALTTLRGELADAALESGLKEALRDARLDLAYALLRTDARVAAVRAAWPLLYGGRGVQGLRDVAAIAAGALTGQDHG